MKILLAVLVVFLCSVAAQPLPTRTYEYDRTLFSDIPNSKYFRFYWSIDEQNGNLDAAMVCLQTDPGWCGIGWSVIGSMVGSDSVIGSVVGTNTAIIVDFMLQQQTPPGNGTCPNGVCPDTARNSTCRDDITNAIGRRVGQYMVLEFTRPLSTSDPVISPPNGCDLDIPISDPNQYILCAWGAGYAPNDIARHTDRGINASFNWVPPYFTTSPLTSAALTTTPLSTGALTSGVPAVTTGVASVTTGSQITSGSLTTAVAPAVTTGDGGIGTTPATSGSDLQSSSGNTENKIFGLPIWVFALIVAGIALVLILVIVGLAVGLSKRKKKKEYFGGFY